MFHKEILHQTLALLTVCFNEFAVGLADGWLAPTLSSAQKSGRLSIDECSWIASLGHIGKVFGAVISALLIDKIGRKRLLVFSATSFFIMWLAILISRRVHVLYLSRFLFGIAYGINDAANGVYLGENTTPVVRGIFGTVVLSSYYIGLLLEFIAANYFTFATTAFLNTCLMGIAFLCTFWIIEPPQYLLMKGKLDEARENFMWLRAVDDISEIQREFITIQQNAKTEMSKRSSYKILFTAPANYRSLLIMLTLYLLSGSTGYYPIMSYASIAFSSTDIFAPNELTILFGLSQFAVVMSTSFVIEKFDRRVIMLSFYTLIVLLHAVTAVLYYVHENLYRIPYFSWLTFATITSYASIYAFVYAVVFVIRSEMFPLSVKALGGCVAVVGYSVMSFVMTKIFLFVATNLGIYFNFLLFSVVCSVLVLFIYLTVPETRNKTLIEIQEILSKEY